MIEWLFLSHQPQHTITTYITALRQLITKGHDRVSPLFSHHPAVIYLPLTQVYLQLYSQSLQFQCAVTDFVGNLNIHLPSKRLLQNLPTLNICIGEKFSTTPIPKARTIFIDGSGKTGKAAITWKEGNEWKHFLSGGHSSTQWAEISRAILALQHWPKEPLNLVCDSDYTIYTPSYRSGSIKRVH